MLGPYLYLGWNDGGIAQRQVGRLDNSFVSLHAGTLITGPSNVQELDQNKMGFRALKKRNRLEALTYNILYLG